MLGNCKKNLRRAGLFCFVECLIFFVVKSWALNHTSQQTSHIILTHVSNTQKLRGKVITTYRATGFNWCAVQPYLVTLRLRNKNARQLFSVFLKNSVDEISVTTDVEMRYSKMAAYTIDSCELWNAINNHEECPKQLFVTVEGSETPLSATMVAERVTTAPKNEIRLRYEYNLPVHGYRVGLDLKFASPVVCNDVPKHGRFYWIVAPPRKKYPPRCKSISQTLYLSNRAVYFHEPTKPIIDFRPEEYVRCQQRPVETLPYYKLGQGRTLEFRAFSRNLEETGSTFYSSLDGFDWCSLPAYKLILTIPNYIKFYGLQVSINEQPNAKNSIPLQSSGSSSQAHMYEITSCQIWQLMEDMDVCPDSLQFGFFNVVDVIPFVTVTVQRVAQLSDLKQTGTKNFSKYPINRLPVGLDLSFADASLCKYPKNHFDVFSIETSSSRKKAAPLCHGVAHRSLLPKNSVYFSPAVKDAKRQSTVQNIRCPSLFSSWKHACTSPNHIRIPNIIQSVTLKALLSLSTRGGASCQGPQCDELSLPNVRETYQVEGFDWCSTDPYKMSLSFRNSEKKPTRVFLTLEPTADILDADYIELETSSTSSTYSADSCKIWALIKRNGICQPLLFFTAKDSNPYATPSVTIESYASVEIVM